MPWLSFVYKRERNIFSNADSEACLLKFKTNDNQITREWGCKKGCIDKFFDVFVGEHLKCFDENAKMRAAKQRWEPPLPLMFVDVTLSKRLTTTRGDGGRRVWDEKLFAGMRRLLLNTTFCVYNTHIYILVNCAHVHICVKSVQMMKLNMIICICAGMTRGFSSRSSVLVSCHHFVLQSCHSAQRFSK